MERLDSEERTWRAEVARLAEELEQARVALEDAQSEIGGLIGEREQLRATVAQLDRARADADKALLHLRDRAAGATVRMASALRQTSGADKLRTVLEETSVLAEELQAANEELREANEELDHRVSERTVALGLANSELERVNAELHRRVETEAVARAKVQAELFQMQKLEAIGQLTGGIAHDFNNLLMVIINGLQVLTEPKGEAQRERALRRTQEASWRAAELTRRLLAFARRQSLHPGRVDISQQADGLRELLGQSLRDDIQLRVSATNDVWPLEADIGALELALLNLAVNARDAMPGGGSLTITARNVVMDRVAAAGVSVSPGDYVEIAVEDTGVGMPPEVLAKVFEPFFTTKNAGQGTGLGLSQVYGFAQQSEGTASVESRQGEGTVVRLLLPRSRRPIEAPSRIGPVATPRQRGELSVLVVEDDVAVAAMVIDMLERLGHRGRSVITVAAAMAVLTEPGTDLIITDVLLPGGESGLDLARQVQQRRLGVPVILTSGYGGSMTQRLSAMNLPLLRKPYQLSALSQAIEAAMSMRCTIERAG
jgi:signal transduction histidine kinase/ActR/RegA family two-component response regulator